MSQCQYLPQRSNSFAVVTSFLQGSCILQRYQDGDGNHPVADAAKLYWHFTRTQGSGVAGIFITLFLYTFTCFTAAAILYMYFLRFAKLFFFGRQSRSSVYIAHLPLFLQPPYPLRLPDLRKGSFCKTYVTFLRERQMG